ncbi:Rv3654c family TadE-like protein [Cellulosimicrobium sp. Marseille-Q4280]|uniref:Rv3654c family TadE-like protein n=1 Tax=Cellulosimicrobium sp. Marseille-Q4280 TaxID=2937992 RepID=UPI00203F3A4D|nr:Rv3654c family TadE-like protein [Cellulosimicrobium sp. Marseille-Q4280]
MTGRRGGRGPGLPGVGSAAERSSDGEHGAGTVLVLGIVAALLVVLVGLGGLAQAQAARGRAQAGADLAALAAAAALRDGWEPCGRARETASRNGVRVVACTETGAGAVRVDVVSGPTVSVLGVTLGEAAGAARAGPATARAG